MVITLLGTDVSFRTEAIFDIHSSGAIINKSISLEGFMLQETIDISLTSKKLDILPKYVFMFLTVTKFKFSL